MTVLAQSCGPVHLHSDRPFELHPIPGARQAVRRAEALEFGDPLLQPLVLLHRQRPRRVVDDHQDAIRHPDGLGARSAVGAIAAAQLHRLPAASRMVRQALEFGTVELSGEEDFREPVVGEAHIGPGSEQDQRKRQVPNQAVQCRVRRWHTGVRDVSGHRRAGCEHPML